MSLFMVAVTTFKWKISRDTSSLTKRDLTAIRQQTKQYYEAVKARKWYTKRFEAKLRIFKGTENEVHHASSKATILAIGC